MGIFSSKADRDAEADRQLASGKRSLFKNNGASGRMWGRPDNAGLSDREIKALERENGKGIGGRGFHSAKR